MMNEAALYILQGRRHEGRRNKAQRGDLLHHPPMGYVRGADGDSQLDPDEQAQRVVRLIFGLLLDSRVVDVPLSSNAIVVTLLSWNTLFFNGLQNGLRFSDAVGVEAPGIQ